MERLLHSKGELQAPLLNRRSALYVGDMIYHNHKTKMFHLQAFGTCNLQETEELVNKLSHIRRKQSAIAISQDKGLSFLTRQRHKWEWEEERTVLDKTNQINVLTFFEFCLKQTPFQGFLGTTIPREDI